MNRPG